MRLTKSAIKGGVAVVVAVAAVFYFGSGISELSKNIADKKIQNIVNQKEGAMVEELQRNFDLIGQNDKTIADAFPPADDIINFTFMLDSLAERMSLKTTESFGNPTVDQGDDHLDYSVSFGGNIYTLLKYAENFEKLPYFTAIQSMSLNSLANDWEGDCSINLKARLFVK